MRTHVISRGDVESLTREEDKLVLDKIEVGKDERDGASVVVSPTTPTPQTPGDDNPVFSIPRTEVSL